MPMSGKKMTGKQAIAGGFDLDAFVGGAEPFEKIEPKQPKSSRLAKTVEKAAGGEKVVKPRARSSKEPTELVSERVQLMVSVAELERIKAQAGLVSVSKFLRQFLKEHGLI